MSYNCYSMVTKQWNCIYFWSAEHQKWHFEIQVMGLLCHWKRPFYWWSQGEKLTKVFVKCKRNMTWLERDELVHINMSQHVQRDKQSYKIPTNGFHSEWFSMESVTEAKEIAFTNHKVNNNPPERIKTSKLWLVFAHWSENKGVRNFVHQSLSAIMQNQL